MNPIKSSYKWIASGLSGKTAWEWLELLIVPLGLAVGAFYLENRVENRQERIATERYEQERSIADERAKQDVLDSYLERMQELLLDRGLRESSEDSEVRSVARAITTTAFKELGWERNALLVDFLQESNLISSNDNLEKESVKGIAILSGLNLSRVNLDFANLIEANLSGANLSEANLSNAKLIEANLSNANLLGTDLSDANLIEADLSRAILIGADLSTANLLSTDLSNANLSYANLSGANLLSTDLSNANLSYADLSHIDPYDADLNYSNLSDTELTLITASVTGAVRPKQEQIEQALLCSTKLPKGIDIDPNRDCKSLAE